MGRISVRRLLDAFGNGHLEVKERGAVRMKKQRILIGLGISAAAVALLVVSVTGARAGGLAAPAMDVVVTTTADSGFGSLRWALQAAGANDTIVFNPVVFPPGDPQTITLASALPDITQGNLTIDGSAAGVILDGSGLSGGENGISIASSGNTVKGLQVLHFPGNGVFVSSGASHNLIGGANATPGGACSGACNLISGHGDSGVRIEGEGTMSNTVSGNYIGTNVAGTVCIYNNHNEAVRLRDGASYTLVGGRTPAERNLLGCEGLTIGDPWSSGSVHNRIINNYVGVDPTDSFEFHGDAWQGILFWEDGSHAEIISNTIRGMLGQGIWIYGYVEEVLVLSNTVSNNGRANEDWASQGILLSDVSDVRLMYNSVHSNSGPGVMVGGSASQAELSHNNIYGNAGSGIELVDGANGGIQPPRVAYTNAVTGVASGAACAGCRVEVFSDSGDEGRWYEGMATATITGAWTLSKGSPFVGPQVHGTATDALGNTSEFSFGSHWIFLPLLSRQS
jgi:parallel beta-helix repeat protein